MREHDQPIAANVLARQFDAAGHNQRWVGDTTEFCDRRQREALPGRDFRPIFAVHLAPASSSTGLSAP
jgi:hypothetical protein